MELEQFIKNANIPAVIHSILPIIQSLIAVIGTIVILSGVLIALFDYIRVYFKIKANEQPITINIIRLKLTRTLILGLEFIVAADLIGTTTTPDYYSLGILASIVAIRTALNFSLNRELMSLSKES